MRLNSLDIFVSAGRAGKWTSETASGTGKAIVPPIPPGRSPTGCCTLQCTESLLCVLFHAAQLLADESPVEILHQTSHGVDMHFQTGLTYRAFARSLGINALDLAAEYAVTRPIRRYQ